MTQPKMPVEGRYGLGAFELQSGKVLHDANIGYAAWGTLNAAGDNAIVYPTWYTGRHDSNAPFIGKGKALDPQREFRHVDFRAARDGLAQVGLEAPEDEAKSWQRGAATSLARLWHGKKRVLKRGACSVQIG